MRTFADIRIPQGRDVPYTFKKKPTAKEAEFASDLKQANYDRDNLIGAVEALLMGREGAEWRAKELLKELGCEGW